VKASDALVRVIDGRRVIVLGKGPSLTNESLERHRSGACVIGINQTVRTFTCDVAFFIDIEPFLESLPEIMASRVALVLPWHPNQRTWIKRISKPMAEDLHELCARMPELRELDQQGRLYYFHTAMRERRAARNVFEPNLVSLSALLQILAAIGVRRVETLGVDGGAGYSAVLKGSLYTQLHAGYDRQFPILRRIAMTNGVTLARADAQKIQVFVGAEPEQELAVRVLEYSIRYHTREDVSIVSLHKAVGGKELATAGRTPFSCQRFFIPQLCGYRGLAIYLDSDMQVFADIRELVGLYEQGRAVCSADAPPGSGRRPQYSVMVINCELARWNPDDLLDRAQQEYEKTLFDFSFEPNKSRNLPYTWNSLETFEPGKTCLLHYTDMDDQPWIAASNPLAPVWIETLCSAVRDGFINFDEVRSAAAQGFVRPGLLYQIEHNIFEPRRIPRRERLKDELYLPPHTVARFSSRNGPVVRAGLAIAKKAYNALRGRS
jgi:hypothetical protein